VIFPEVKQTLLDEKFKNNEKFLFSVNGSIIDESTYQVQSIDHTVNSKKRYQLPILGNSI
jgi:hypothetical protein